MAGRSKSGDRDDGVTISFGAKFARSDQFKAVFREGMALVEAAATYLDGDGRKEARKLRPPHSLAYATESMRLTTRLMQLASWLLIRRAVSEGELTPEQAVEEQRKIKLPVTGSEQPCPELGGLPARLRDLIEQSVKLQERVIRLDQMLGHKRLPPTGEPTTRSRRSCRACARRSAESRVAVNRHLRKPSYFRLKRVSAAAAVGQMLAAAGPGRMGLRIDVELERVALGPIGRIGRRTRCRRSSPP